MFYQSRDHEYYKSVQNSDEVLLPIVRRFCLIVVAVCTFASQATAQFVNAEPGIYSSALPGFTTDSVFIDATLFVNASGGPYDMCQAIILARQSSACGAANNSGGAGSGCRVWAPFTGVQQCSADPFGNGGGLGTGNSWGNGGELDLRGSAPLDIRTAVTWHVPNGVHLIGLGDASPSTTSNNFNTILRANNTAIFNGGTLFSVPSETITQISAETCSGNICYATVTATNTMCAVHSGLGYPDNGQDVQIVAGTNAPSFWKIGTYTGHAFDISTCSNAGVATSFRVSVPPSTVTTCSTSPCGTAYEGTPVLMMSQLSQPAGQYRVEVEGMAIDAAFQVGVLPILNDNSEELSGWHHMGFYNSGIALARVTQVATAGAGDGFSSGGGASNSGPYYDFSGNYIKEICELPTAGGGCNGVAKGAQVDETTVVTNPLGCQTVGLMIDGPKCTGMTTCTGAGTATINTIRDVSDFTLSANDPDPANNNNTPVVMNASTCGYGSAYNSMIPLGIEVIGVNAHVHGFHVEYFPGDIQIGGDPLEQAAYPGINSYGAAVNTNGVTFSNEETCCGTGPTIVPAYDLGPNTGDIDIFGLGRGTSFLVHNAAMANADCTDSNLTEGYYLFGHGTTPSLLTTCPSVTWQTAGPLALSSPLTVANGGTGTSSTLSGLVRGGSPFTAAELSADATTSGSNAVTVVGVNGGPIPTSATALASNGSNQIIAATYQGNGAKVQLSAGSATSNDLAKFDSNGNTINSTVTDNGTVVSTVEPFTTSNLLTMLRAKVSGSAPSCAFTSGGGTAPSCAVQTGSTDTAGVIQLTVGNPTAIVPNGSVTLTFTSTFGTNHPVCLFVPSQAGAGQWVQSTTVTAAFFDKTPTTSSDVQNWQNGNTVLSASTTYYVNYMCFAK